MGDFYNLILSISSTLAENFSIYIKAQYNVVLTNLRHFPNPGYTSLLIYVGIQILRKILKTKN